MAFTTPMALPSTIHDIAPQYGKSSELFEAAVNDMTTPASPRARPPRRPDGTTQEMPRLDAAATRLRRTTPSGEPTDLAEVRRRRDQRAAHHAPSTHAPAPPGQHGDEQELRAVLLIARIFGPPRSSRGLVCVPASAYNALLAFAQRQLDL